MAESGKPGHETQETAQKPTYCLPRKKHVTMSERYNHKVFDGNGLNVKPIKEAINRVIVATNKYRENREPNQDSPAKHTERMQVEA